MFTHDFLKQIEDAIFQPYFLEGILAIHEDKVNEGEYRSEIRDYQKAMASLTPALNEEEAKMLAQYEGICESIRELYAKHGFVAGIYAGFRQILTPASEFDAGYDKYVMDEVMKLPNMKRYHELYKAVTSRNELYEKLADGRVENCDSPIVCISCYWSEMACSAAAIAFYCGYRVASSITDRFGLMETDYMARTAKLLVFEHAFRYIETIAEKERRLERQKNGMHNDDDESPEEADEEA